MLLLDGGCSRLAGMVVVSALSEAASADNV